MVTENSELFQHPFVHFHPQYSKMTDFEPAGRHEDADDEDEDSASESESSMDSGSHSESDLSFTQTSIRSEMVSGPLWRCN